MKKIYSTECLKELAGGMWGAGTCLFLWKSGIMLIDKLPINGKYKLGIDTIAFYACFAAGSLTKKVITNGLTYNSNE